MTPQFWLWLDTILMALGAAAILAIGKRRTTDEESHTIYHGIVPIIAACSYFAMAIGQGATLLPALAIVNPTSDTAVVVNRVFYFARYIDWSFTTPLLLLALAGTALHTGPKRHGLILGLVLSDLLMIVTAFFFGASVVPLFKWIWFVISCGAFAAVYWIIWVPLRQQSMLARPDVQARYKTNATVLSVLWFIYPFVLLVSPDGLGVIGSTLAVALIAILDVLAKVAFGISSTLGSAQTVDRDLATGHAVHTSSHAVHTTPRPIV